MIFGTLFFYFFLNRHFWFRSQSFLPKLLQLPTFLMSSSSSFALKKNQLQSSDLEYYRNLLKLDDSKYRIREGSESDISEMSNEYIPIPLTHFDSGLRLPLDPAFSDFLFSIKAQPAHLHSNTVKYITCLIVLCRRLGFEITENIIHYYFESLKFEANVLSMRPRTGKIRLFDSIPNKVQWRSKWVLVESSVGFPFPPFVKDLESWNCPDSNSFSAEEKGFIDYIEKNLQQIKFYSMNKLLSEKSLEWCGIGSTSERRSELGLDDSTIYDMWAVHPDGVFGEKCEICRNETSYGCLRGNDLKDRDLCEFKELKRKKRGFLIAKLGKDPDVPVPDQTLQETENDNNKNNNATDFIPISRRIMTNIVPKKRKLKKISTNHKRDHEGESSRSFKKPKESASLEKVEEMNFNQAYQKIGTLIGEYNKLEAKNDELCTKISTLEAKNDGLNAKISTLETEKDELNAKISTLEAKVKELTEKNIKLSNFKIQAKSQVDRLEQVLTHLKTSD